MLAPSHPMEAEMPAQSPARPALEATSPTAYRAMIRLDGEIGKLALDERLRRLIELRVSQLNGCAYCLAMHTVEARNADVDESAIATVAAWHESPFFSDAERAALALADSVTSPAAGISDETWLEATKHHGDAGVAAIVWSAIAMNAWNRLAVATKLVAEPVT